MNAQLTLLSILFISLVGYTVIRGFKLLRKENTILAIGCSYGVGIGLITMQMYIYSRINIPWGIPQLITLWIAVSATFLLINRHRIGLPALKKQKVHLVDIVLILGIICAIGYTVFEALLRPVSAWDAWVTWLLKAKVFFLDGTVTPVILDYLKVSYPLVINLLGSFVYVMIGQVDDTSVLLTWSAFNIFISIVLFGLLKPRYGLRYALVFTFLLVTTQNFVRHGGRYEAGLADLPLGYFAFCSVALLLEYIKKSECGVFILLDVFLGITGLIKFEGITLGTVIELLASYHIYKNKLYRHIVYIAFWIAPILEWQIYKSVHHTTEAYFSTRGFAMSLPKTINAFAGTVSELINIKSWNVMWIIYFYSLLVIDYRKNKELVIINIVVLFQLAVYMVMYLCFARLEPQTSIERLLMHIAPLVLYYMAMITYICIKNNRRLLRLFSWTEMVSDGRNKKVQA